ncbi:MAG: hypothetical protein ACYDH6_11695 [Acidimicrobiales bacterium]
MRVRRVLVSVAIACGLAAPVAATLSAVAGAHPAGAAEPAGGGGVVQSVLALLSGGNI